MNPDLYSELYEDAQATISDLNDQIRTLELIVSDLQDENQNLRDQLDFIRYGD